MNQSIVICAFLIFGAILGAVIAWFVMRGRIRLQIESAIAQASLASQVESAQKDERLKGALDEVVELKAGREQSLKQYNEVRIELDRSRDEQARLTERSVRVPQLEADVRALQQTLSERDEELRALAASEAQKGQLVSSLNLKISELGTDNQTLRGDSMRLNEALGEANRRTAALGEQAAQVPGLETTKAALSEQVRKTSEELRLVSTSEAQQRQLAESTLNSLEKLAVQHRNGESRLESVSRELQEANERRATLEEQAAQIAPLSTKLELAEARLLETSKAFSELREASGRSNGQLAAELVAERDAIALVRRQYEEESSARRTADSEVARLSEALTELRTSSEAEQKHAEEKLLLLTRAREELSVQFKTLANEILEEKSKRFTEQNQSNLDQLLEPLKTRLKEFQGKVEEVYVQEGKDRTALAEQVKQLHALNQALSEDAKNLTSALKGSSKTQGNWGELILERVLESSGLRKGHEYLVQDSQMREDGTRAQPDVVILLPEERKLVVDSKVSLVAYEAYASAETEEQRALSLRQHVDSIRSHIRSLSDKQYHALYGKSLDFVLAFVPIEPAFMLAITNDKDIFMEALNRNVLLVSPSTLLFVVRTVAHLWRQEAQNRNAQEIARRGAELYDKLCGFVGDFENFGNRLKQAQAAYDSAQGKLVSGKGNVIRQAEMLRELGVKPSKLLPESLVEASNGDGDPIVIAGALVGGNSALGLPSVNANLESVSPSGT